MRNIATVKKSNNTVIFWFFKKRAFDEFNVNLSPVHHHQAKEIRYFSEENNIKPCIDFLQTDWNFYVDSVQLNCVGGGKAWQNEEEGGKVMVTSNCCHLLSTCSVQALYWPIYKYRFIWSSYLYGANTDFSLTTGEAKTQADQSSHPKSASSRQNVDWPYSQACEFLTDALPRGESFSLREVKDRELVVCLCCALTGTLMAYYCLYWM